MGRRVVWTVITILLIAVIVSGGIVAWQRYSPPHTIEIYLLTPTPTEADATVSHQEPPQQIDINRAEAWLLEALPGIGPSKAQAIIDYRQQNGGFKHITEITRVEGIGPAIYEQIATQPQRC
jgi:comEA protein